jgi:homoserine kinase
VLPQQISRAVAVHQAAQVGAMIAALASGDYALLGRAIDDRIAEPARAGLLPGFREAKQAALRAGALGSSISGSGPTAFALVRGFQVGGKVGDAMAAAYAGCGFQSEVRLAQIDREGARLVDGDRT